MISADMKRDLRIRVSQDATFNTDQEGRRTAPDGSTIVGGQAKTSIRKTKQQAQQSVQAEKSSTRKTKKGAATQPVKTTVPVTIQVAGAKFTAQYNQVHTGEAILVLCSNQPAPFMPQPADLQFLMPRYKITHNGATHMYIYTGLMYKAHNMKHVIMLEIQE